MSDDVKSIPVAIAGGGPVGLMLALYLDHYGVPSVIFNSEPEVRRHPKGSTHNARTMEHHRQLGIAPQVRDLCLPINRPTDVSYYTRLTGWELGRIPMASEAEKRRAVAASVATDQTPEPLLRANQMYVEEFLLAHARTRPNITIRFGWQLTGFQEDAGGVTVAAEAAGGQETWRAQYLAGCDGGRSFVRRALALRYNGFATLDSPLLRRAAERDLLSRTNALPRSPRAPAGLELLDRQPEGPLHDPLAQQRRRVPGVLQSSR